MVNMRGFAASAAVAASLATFIAAPAYADDGTNSAAIGFSSNGVIGWRKM